MEQEKVVLREQLCLYCQALWTHCQRQAEVVERRKLCPEALKDGSSVRNVLMKLDGRVSVMQTNLNHMNQEISRWIWSVLPKHGNTPSVGFSSQGADKTD